MLYALFMNDLDFFGDVYPDNLNHPQNVSSLLPYLHFNPPPPPPILFPPIFSLSSAAVTQNIFLSLRDGSDYRYLSNMSAQGFIRILYAEFNGRNFCAATRTAIICNAFFIRIPINLSKRIFVQKITACD